MGATIDRPAQMGSCQPAGLFDLFIQFVIGAKQRSAIQFELGELVVVVVRESSLLLLFCCCSCCRAIIKFSPSKLAHSLPHTLSLGAAQTLRCAALGRP